MKLDRRTHKLYYDDFYLSQAQAKVVKVGPDFIELDATVAYPEGGGQEGDHGVISLPDGRTFRFIDAKKLYAHLAGLPEFPGVQVEGVIWHMVHPDDQPLLAGLEIGSAVTVGIDIERRARLTLSHTASHLLYLGVGMHRPDAVASTIGCHIKVDSARFDFAVRERITAEQIAQIESSANAFVTGAATISVSAHPQAPDARLWHLDHHVIACGGTHLDCAAPVGMLQVRRKSLGAGKERLSCDFPAAAIDVGRYHA